MNMSIEKDLPLEEIQRQISGGETLRGDPSSVIETCQTLPWENPCRVWTFWMNSEPSRHKLEAFMERFELVFSLHEEKGEYQYAWCTVQGSENHAFIMKGLFCDSNPATGPGFNKRAADGPRIALWFGRFHKMLDDCGEET
jgi:hypothetical protein